MTGEPDVAVTIKDLAQMANTSTATVSRVLSNKPGVAEDKRQSILRLAEQVGYRPNRTAQNLALKKSYIIGLVGADLQNAAYLDFFRHLQHALQNDGYRVLIADSERDVEKEKHNIETMREQRAEGIVVFPVHDWDNSVEIDHFLELKLQKFPFVLIGRLEGYGFDCVASEELETAKGVTRHLLEFGHREFAFIGDDSRNRCVQERRDGVELALKQAGLTLKQENVIREHDGWLEELREMMTRTDAPTALVYINDTAALATHRTIQEMGLKAPDDFSFTCFGNNLWAPLMVPSYTTTQENNEEIATVALRLLMKRIEDPSAKPSQVLVQQELIMRESAGPAPNHNGGKRRTARG